MGLSSANADVNARAIFGGMQDTLKDMDETTRKAVFAEIKKIKSKASQEIKANGGSWNCAAGETAKACNLINSIQAYLKEEKQKNDDGGMTM